MSQSKYNVARGTVPKIWEWVELGVGCDTPRKSSRIRYNFLAGTEALLSPITSQSQCKFFLGGTVPQFWVGVELGGRVWHPVKVLLNRSNLCAGTETLSLSSYEPITMQFFDWGPSPNLG